ncbi:MAG: hypothetical protein ACT4PT_03735 [Methanobacteriota archaeon]
MAAARLVGAEVVVEDPKEAHRLYNKGAFGTPRPGGGSTLTAFEALYLSETERLAIGRDVGAGLRTGVADEGRLAAYGAFRDLRERGLVARETAAPWALETHPRGGFPGKTAPDRLVAAFGEHDEFVPDDLLALADDAERRHRAALVSVCDEDTDVTYYAVRRDDPRGAAAVGEGRTPVVGPRETLVEACYEDLVKRGLLPKAGYKYGVHFRVYDTSPAAPHSPYLVKAIAPAHREPWRSASGLIRLAHGVRKKLLFRVADAYLRIGRVTP